jgi:hypothetical protein
MICRTKKWGNSIGIVIPKEEVNRLNLGEEQDITVTIVKQDNPFRELWNWGKKNGHKPITRKEFLEHRKLLESKWMK